jgi:pyridoxine 5-phosphate synthase
MAADIRLGVNVDHVATLRQARGTDYPDPVDAAVAAERAGAGSITVHLREDRRHIQDHDVLRMKERIATKLNLEMAAADEIVAFGCRVRPADCCLVPERRAELTTEGGLAVAGHEARVGPIVRRLAEAGVRVSLFIAPDPREIEAARNIRAPVVELHTGAYAEADDDATRAAELERLRIGTQHAHELGLIVNAGHGLTVDNVGPIAALPEIEELNIGHSIVARAVFVGIEEAVREMLRACQEARTGAGKARA